MDKVRQALERLGVPPRDRYDLPDSPCTFPDGAHYRMEISGVETLEEMRELVEEVRRTGNEVHRIIALGEGATLETRANLRQWCRLAAEIRAELVVQPGPRPNWDAGSHVHSSWGMASGRRIRGSERLVDYITDILRACAEGVRGFLLYGEDVLWVMNQMRDGGEMPSDVVFKVSYTAGHANAAGGMLLERLGADSFNPVSDLELPMLAAIRQATTLPLDLVVRAHEGLGGINRICEAAEMARVASPVYFKQELFGATGEKVRYCGILREAIEAECPQLSASQRGPDDLRVPAAPEEG